MVAVTRNKSLYVKTLHVLMAIQSLCTQQNIPFDITFCDDADATKMDMLKKKMKSCERLVWMEYGLSLDRESVVSLPIKYDGYDGLIYPAALQNQIDWDKFKVESLKGTTEPVEQIALTFDTDVTDKVIDKQFGFKSVTKTVPQIWALDTKRVGRKMKGDKKYRTINEYFAGCLSSSVKLAAATQARTFVHFPHECPGNILNVAGITVNRH